MAADNREYADRLFGDLEKCRKYELPTERDHIDPNIYDLEDIYPNCTVQVLTNSRTGNVSVGWWKNEEEPF